MKGLFNTAHSLRRRSNLRNSGGRRAYVPNFSSEGALSEENTSSQPPSQLCSSLSTENLQLELQANIGSDGLSDKECVVRRMKTQVRQSTDRLAQVIELCSLSLSQCNEFHLNFFQQPPLHTVDSSSDSEECEASSHPVSPSCVKRPQASPQGAW